MRPLPIIAGLWLVSMAAHPQAPKPKACKELKAEIARKIEANGAGTYTLDIVAKDQQAEGAVVGFCDGGTKKIVYRRGSTPPQAPAPKPAKPQASLADRV